MGTALGMPFAPRKPQHAKPEAQQRKRSGLRNFGNSGSEKDVYWHPLVAAGIGQATLKSSRFNQCGHDDPRTGDMKRSPIRNEIDNLGAFRVANAVNVDLV